MYGFPLTSDLTDEALIICPCVAIERDLPMKGPRGCIGAVLELRNEAWVNPCPPAWIALTGNNGDIKLPLRVPILPETHEVKLFDVKTMLRNV